MVSNLRKDISQSLKCISKSVYVPVCFMYDLQVFVSVLYISTGVMHHITKQYLLKIRNEHKGIALLSFI